MSGVTSTATSTATSTVAGPSGATAASATADAAHGTAGTAGKAILWVLIGCQFMVSMDATIVNVALPTIGNDLSVGQLGLGWVVNAYALVFGGFLLVGARAGDRYGRRRVFMVGMSIFTAASLVCGLADNSPMLIAARAAQGLGAAIMSPVAMSTILATFDGAVRHRALGLWSSMSGVAGSVGMLAGGALSLASWRWNFLVNVPIGLLALWLAHRLLPENPGEKVGRPDLVGAVLSTVGLSVLLYAVVETDRYGWGSARTILLASVAVLLLVLFVLAQTRVRNPMVPLAIFGNRNVSVGNAITALTGGVGQITYFVLTLFLQQVLGLSALLSGIVFVPISIAIFVASVPAATYVRRLGLKVVLVAGFVLLIASMVWLAGAARGAGSDAGYLGDLLVPTLLFGLGFGLTQSGSFIAGAQGVSVAQAGVASGLISTTYRVGGAFWLATAITIATGHTPGGTASADAGDLATGYSWAFGGAAVLALVACGLSFLLPSRQRTESR